MRPLFIQKREEKSRNKREKKKNYPEKIHEDDVDIDAGWWWWWFWRSFSVAPREEKTRDDDVAKRR